MSTVSFPSEIEVRENDLFTRWKAASQKPFYRDGVRQPKRFTAAHVKTLFVLREANFDGEPCDYDFRPELLCNPHPFWKDRMFPWCFGLTYHNDGSAEALWERYKTSSPTKDTVFDTLDNFGFIQIKKCPGGAKSKATELIGAVEQDANFLREQLSIYCPDVIVACGAGNPKTFSLLQDYVFGSGQTNASNFGQYTFQKTGRRYAKINDSTISPRSVFMIEAFHPSHYKSRRDAFIRLVSDYQCLIQTHFQIVGAAVQ